MKKLLYVTDQDEYVDHSFITSLFENYLNKYLNVDIVYFTEFKSDFEQKDKHKLIVPSRYKNILLTELNSNNISVGDYSYIIVRNDITIMKHVLKEKSKYAYKTAFRFSFPKRRRKLRRDQANNRGSFIDIMADKIKTMDETKVINACDVFLPTSQSMHETFFPNVSTRTMICPPGISPDLLRPNIQHEGQEKRFFYAGTLDKIRKFETVLEAFSKVENQNWKLNISTMDTQYAHDMISRYKGLEEKIEICNAKNREELLKFIALADIGIALLPNMPIYNTSTPVKILDYYTSAIPCIMTNSGHTNKIFTDCNDAWFCQFEQDDIKEKIEYILSLSKETVAEVGVKGQKRLLEIRNYENMAEDLAMKLEML